MSLLVLQSRNVSDTIRIGRRIGRHLHAGDVIALEGELGTGKTHLIKGVAAGVGVERALAISSPSYVLIQEYPGRIPFYHIDLYRLKTEREAEELGLEDYFGGQGVTAIEWADRIPSLLPEEILRVRIEFTEGRKRSIQITGLGKRYEELVTKLSETS